MRLHLALNVADLDAAVDYYTRILGVGVNKREPGYANLVVEDPALKLVLFEDSGAGERLNHLGFEVASDGEVQAAAQRLEQTDVAHEQQLGETCCYAKQNNVVSFDPQGLMWEWYRVLEDSPSFFAEAEDSAGCCAASESTTESYCC